MDVPIVLKSSSPGTLAGSDLLSQPGMIETTGDSEPHATDGSFENISEDALTDTLESPWLHTKLIAEKEHFDPIDSISRVAVPIMDFTTPPSTWTDYVSCPKDQFSWLRADLALAFAVPFEPQSRQHDKSLKWAPFPCERGRVLAHETIEPLSEAASQLLSPDPAPHLSSASYFTPDRRLAIQRGRDEEEVGRVTLFRDDEMNDSTSPRNDRALAGPPPPAASNSQDQNLESLVSEIAGKRRREQTSGHHGDPLGSFLPSIGDIDATSKLLSGFMEMRAVKKAKVFTSHHNSTCKAGTRAISGPSRKQPLVTQVQPPPDVEETLIPSPVPDVLIPEQKSIFIISIGIGASILRHIESSWSPDHLFDRDYTLHNSVVWSPGSAQGREVASPLSFDADVALTPSVGLIVTTLLRVKQKPLLGCQALPRIRERVLQVSQKYETLFVLVSESNTPGESMGNLSTSDAAAYADFVGFTVALQSDVVTYLVLGPDITLAKWILALMCRFSPHAMSLSQFLNAVESTWEVFFRRAGMNAVAAQVLAGTLFEEAGNKGHARFVTMSLEERVSAYGQLLGGRRALVNVSKILDGAWS